MDRAPATTGPIPFDAKRLDTLMEEAGIDALLVTAATGSSSSITWMPRAAVAARRVSAMPSRRRTVFHRARDQRTDAAAHPRIVERFLVVRRQWLLRLEPFELGEYVLGQVGGFFLWHWPTFCPVDQASAVGGRSQAPRLISAGFRRHNVPH
jgi:hypothetical protein